MRALAISLVELRRLVRDKTNLFFLFVFPIVLILLIGASFGGDFTPKLGLLVEDRGGMTKQLLSALRDDDSIDVERVSSRADLRDWVERGLFEAGVIVEAGYTETLLDGRDASIEYLAQPGDFGAAIRATVDAAIGEQAARIQAARAAQEETDVSLEEALATVDRVAPALPGSEVSYSVAGDRSAIHSGDQFGAGASTQLVLFTFVNSLAGSVALIQTRQYGVLRRMLSTPTSATSILAGETLGRFFVAALQGVFIIVAAALLFGVQWGDPLGAIAVMLMFSLVSTGAAMVFGALLRTEQQAGALVPFALALAALGGSMVPLEVFPETMRTVARITPHAWANEAFSELRINGATVIDLLPQLGVLAAFAAALLVSGATLLRRRLTA